MYNNRKTLSNNYKYRHNWRTRLWFCFLLSILLTTNVLAQNYDHYSYDDDEEVAVPDTDSVAVDGIVPELQPANINYVSCSTYQNNNQMCDCGYKNEVMTLFIRPSNVHEIFIINCKKIIIPANSFANLPQLSEIIFRNIEELELESNSITIIRPNQRVRILFDNVIVNHIPANSITGWIDKITFENSHIGIFSAFAISGILRDMDSLIFQNTIIQRFESQAIKKFTIESISIQNTTIVDLMPSKAFYDIDVQNDFSIRHSTFPLLRTQAFSMNRVGRFRLERNVFNGADGEAFKMKIENSIVINGNEFLTLHSSAFRLIEVDPSYIKSEPMDFIFNNNFVNLNGGPDMIRFNDRFNVRITNLHFPSLISCIEVNELRDTEFLTHNADSIFVRIGDLSSTDEKQYHTFNHALNNKCADESYLNYIVIGMSTITGILLIIVLIAAYICIKRRNEKRRLDIVLPEPKTYRETQIVMQIENAGLLKTDL